MPSAPSTSAGSLTLANRGDSTRQPRLKVEIAFASTWDDSTPAWDDVTSLLRTEQLSVIGSGRPDETQRSSPASVAATFDNRDRSLDPSYTAGPYGAKVTPRRQVQIRAEWAGTIYWLFRGWTASWMPSYPSKGQDAKVALTCVDLFAILNIPIPDGTAFVAQSPGDRIDACLDLISFPAALRNLDAGTAEMPAMAAPSGSILGHIMAVADSDGGFFYTGPDGAATYEGRMYRTVSQASPVATFGDLSPELPYADIVPSADDAYLFTTANITPGDGTPVAIAEDAAAVAEYGPNYTFTRSVLTGFNEAQAAAEWYVARYKDPAVRFISVEQNGDIDPDTLWPVLLAAYNSRRYTFMMRPLGAGAAMDSDSFIERIDHHIQGGRWITNWSLSPFGDETPWILGDAAYVLGTGTYPTW